MEKLVIEGGQPLRGTVRVSGAKNAALPLLAATLLTDGVCEFHNVPALRDVATMIRILRALGVRIQQANSTVTVDPREYTGVEASYKLVSTMRASFCVLGPLLARHKKARVSLPGGCVIGPRPVDLHLKGLRALGASIKVEGGYVVAEAKELRGAPVYLGGAYGSSVLATANVMMAATLARGTTVIENAACEPEVMDLADCLVAMGAKIAGQGTPRLEITGVRELAGVTHSVIPDRIEAGTYLAAAAMTRGDLTVMGARAEHLGAVMDKLREAGVDITVVNGSQLRVKGSRALKPVGVTTLPYPGFPTDMQAQMMALMCVTQGISVITEKIYPDRFMHVAELNRMGAQVMLEGSCAIVKGVKTLSSAPVMASDLRASAALVLAGMAARGTTEISRVYHLDRGYEQLEEKLKTLGAKIRREKED